MSRSERLCWMLAAILLMGAVAMNARATTRQPGECALTALVALEAARLSSPAPRNAHELRFINLSRYLLAHARGSDARFLRWYREACRAGRAPKFVRLDGNRVVMGAGA